jgi:hypothetical protein
MSDEQRYGPTKEQIANNPLARQCQAPSELSPAPCYALAFEQWWRGHGKRALVAAVECMKHADRNEWAIAKEGARVAWNAKHKEAHSTKLSEVADSAAPTAQQPRNNHE